MDIKTYHEEVKPLIANRMQEIFGDVRGLDIGGKHLRGTLCTLLSDALGGDRDKALTSAAVVDAIHMASLVHDDVIDEDVERRGQPSLWITNGIKQAIFTGDRIFAIAQKRAAMLGDKESAEVAEALDTTVAAWAAEGAAKPAEFLIDLFTGRVPEVGYEKLCLTKTAPFFRAAAKLGGIAAKSPIQVLDALSRYGERLGLAFQYSDDYVDMINVQQEKALPPLKKLVPIIPAILHYNGKNIKQALFEVPWGILKDSLVGKDPGEKIVGLLTKVGVVQQLTGDIQKEIENAVQAIEGITFNPGYQDMVQKYPYYAVNLMLAEVNRELKPPIEAKREEI